ncbi:AcfA family outer membrane beta-barrel protein [Photobacterium nomapromontoriensis]|uniref:AcfA family outer membrane beta-barrel protein n=1 Tax=Photobacterium nomapromontoriensis TaxID=2910237 RepID=UPI003D1280B8
MNKALISLLLTCSFSATAAPYVGVEFGMGTSSSDFNSTFKADSVNLSPDLDDGIASAFIGYSFNESWALELGYSQYELSDGSSKYLGQKIIDGQAFHHEMDWDASIKAKQISLAPVFTYALSDKWTTKFKAGLTYTQYKASQGKSEELELITNDDIEMDKTLFHTSHKLNEVGALVSVGSEYEIFPHLTLGANVKYQIDSYSNTTSFNIGSTYYF